MTKPLDRQAPAPRAAALLAALEELGVSHVVGLPDNASAALFRGAQEHETIAQLTVTREGEAFAIAAGLWVGGKTPVVVLQNTGLLESGDSLRGTAVRMGVPLLIVVTYRGHATLRHTTSLQPVTAPAGGSPPDEEDETLPRDLLVRADVDSAAVVTESTLRAWGIPFHTYSSDADLPRLLDAWSLAQRDEQPVAVLLTRLLEGPC